MKLVLAIIVGAVLLAAVLAVLARFLGRVGPEPTREEVADTIEALVNGTGGTWGWDGFLSMNFADPYLARIQQRCLQLHDEFPPTGVGQYCNPEGIVVLLALVRELRSGAN